MELQRLDLQDLVEEVEHMAVMCFGKDILSSQILWALENETLEVQARL